MNFEYHATYNHQGIKALYELGEGCKGIRIKARCHKFNGYGIIKRITAKETNSGTKYTVTFNIATRTDISRTPVGSGCSMEKYTIDQKNPVKAKRTSSIVMFCVLPPGVVSYVDLDPL